MADDIEKLKQYCEAHDNIRLAFIYGSAAAGLAGEDSDIDIGVQLRYPGEENEVWMELTNLTDKEIDLVVLEDAPATLVSNIMKTGLPLTIKDKDLYWDIYLTKTLEAEDFYEFTRSYWQIYERSKSLSLEDSTRLTERIEFLESEFQEIEAFRQLTYKEYLEEKTKRRNIERWAENIVNATIDIAKILLASERKEIPKTYEQALLRFGLLVGLDEKKATVLSSFARLRNILAHQYLDITYHRLQTFLEDSPPIYDAVLGFVHKKI